MIAGVDEAGRGPWAGPVYAAAVILPENYELLGLTDSKLLSEKQRENLFQKITQCAESFGVAFASTEEVDRLNILQASLLAMRRAVEKLSILPQAVWVDGNQDPKLPYPTRLIVQGDLTVPAISAASVLAKVSRDHHMKMLDREFPGYGFAQHKGYGTAAHRAALEKLGPCDCHRRSFQPVKALY